MLYELKRIKFVRVWNMINESKLPKINKDLIHGTMGNSQIFKS